MESDAYKSLRKNESSVSPFKRKNEESSVNLLLDMNSVGETRQSTNINASTTVGLTAGAAAQRARPIPFRRRYPG